MQASTQVSSSTIISCWKHHQTAALESRHSWSRCYWELRAWHAPTPLLSQQSPKNPKSGASCGLAQISHCHVTVCDTTPSPSSSHRNLKSVMGCTNPSEQTSAAHMESPGMSMPTKRREDQTSKSVSRRESPNKQLLTGVKEQDTAMFSIAMHGTSETEPNNI